MTTYGAAETDDTDVEKTSFCKADKKVWLRANWCWIVRVVLAVIGVMVPLIMFLQPCEDILITNYEYVKQPVNLFILLDGSTSMASNSRWTQCKEAALNMTKTFIETDISSLQIGVGQFSGKGVVEGEFTNDTSQALETLSNVKLRYGSTYYGKGLQAYLRAWQSRKNIYENEYSLLVFVSDGEPTDYMNGPKLARRLREDYNISVASILIADEGTDSSYIKAVSSCAGIKDSDVLRECPYYLRFSDFSTFVQKAVTIADNLADQIGTVSYAKEKTTCVKAPWLGFLALLIPLFAVMLMPFCVSRERVFKRRVTKQVPMAKMPPPPPQAALTPPPPPRDSQPAEPGKKKYKWEIKAHDQYLWNMGGGAAPMKVDYGKKAPPSAPRDPYAQPRKVLVLNSTDLGDGYILEEVKEERSLEQWTEDVAADTVNSVRRVMCCCCREKGYEEQTDSDNEEMIV